MIGKRPRNYPLGGWVLVAVGIFLLLGQMFPQNVSLLFAAVAVVSIAGALAARNIGLLIPGGIFAGLALGIYLVDPMHSTASDNTQGGIFMLAFAAGWVLISLLSPLVDRWVWWPLIPGGILALVGWTVWQNRLDWLERLNWLWPLVLVGIGAWILLRPPRGGKT